MSSRAAALLTLAHLLILAIWGCSRSGGDLFVDVASSAGVDFQHHTGAAGERHLPETVAGGAAWLDHDGDGDLDLYLVDGNERSATGGLGTHSNRLFRNDRGRFRDVTAEAGVGDRGYGIAAAVGDYDNDGRPDLYVANFTLSGKEGNVLYHNEGNGRFRDVTALARVAPGGFSTAAAFLDHDGDGLLDLFVVRYVRYDPRKRCSQAGLSSYCSPNDFPGEPDVLYRNRGDGTFEDVSEPTGVGFEDPAGGAGLGVLTLDFDADGDTDIFVANDQGPNYLFRNDGGRFAEVALAAGVAYGPEGAARAGMGVDAADLDVDGREDLVVTHFGDEPDGLFVAQQGALFRDAAAELGVAGPTLLPLGFGVAFTDFDLDGDLDLYIAEGHVQDRIAELRPGSGQTFAQRDLLLENRAGRFADISGQAGSWFRTARVGRAAAAADFDEDGDEDLLIMNAGDRPALLVNQAPRRGEWLALKLRGTRSARDAYGARVAVVLTAEDGSERARFFEVRAARSYASSFDPRVRLGLGPRAPRSVRVVVRWPRRQGKTEEFSGIAAGRTTEIVEGTGREIPPAAFPAPPGALASAAPLPASPRESGPAAPASATGGSATPAASPAPPRVSPAASDGPPAAQPAGPPTAGKAGLDALTRARSLRESHRLAEALEALETGSGAEPALTWEARLLRAELLLSLYRPAEAAAVLEGLLSEEPSRGKAAVLLALALSDQGRFSEAVRRFESLPGGTGRLDGEARRVHARALSGSGRHQDALGECAVALAADPWLEPAYLDYGQLLVRLSRPEAAAPFLARYRRTEEARRRGEVARRLEYEGQEAEARFLRGRLALESGRLLEAMTSFNRALSLDPRHGPSFLALARLSALLERPRDALERLAPLSGEPEVASVRREIEEGLEGEGELSAARREVRDRMAGKPLSASIHELLDLARAYRKHGEPSRARAMALFAAEIAPRDPAAQREAAEQFEAPEEAFVRLWALDRALRLGEDRSLEAERQALAARLGLPTGR